jgi:hypothetical protein
VHERKLVRWNAFGKCSAPEEGGTVVADCNVIGQVCVQTKVKFKIEDVKEEKYAVDGKQKKTESGQVGEDVWKKAEAALKTFRDDMEKDGRLEPDCGKNDNCKCFLGAEPKDWSPPKPPFPEVELAFFFTVGKESHSGYIKVPAQTKVTEGRCANRIVTNGKVYSVFAPGELGLGEEYARLGNVYVVDPDSPTLSDGIELARGELPARKRPGRG